MRHLSRRRPDSAQRGYQPAAESEADAKKKRRAQDASGQCGGVHRAMRGQTEQDSDDDPPDRVVDDRGGNDDLAQVAAHEFHLAHDHGHDLDRRYRKRGAEEESPDEPMAGSRQNRFRNIFAEREAATIEAYVQQRKVVGSLTAELSYLLIRPFLQGDEPELRNFLRNVGAVGCLVDSMIDLRHDARLNLVSFTPTGGAFLILLIRTLTEGLRLSIRYPALLGLFIEAVVDNVRDRFRVRAPAAPRLVTSSGKEGVPSAI